MLFGRTTVHVAGNGTDCCIDDSPHELLVAQLMVVPFALNLVCPTQCIYDEHQAI